MNFDKNLLMMELSRLSQEARTQSKSKKPSLALLRLSASLHSLIKSLDVESSPNSPLTNREQEILQHVSQGFTNREIASALSISEKTIEFHLKSIFQKTEASTRTESVRNALKNRWLE